AMTRSCGSASSGRPNAPRALRSRLPGTATSPPSGRRPSPPRRCRTRGSDSGTDWWRPATFDAARVVYPGSRPVRGDGAVAEERDFDGFVAARRRVLVKAAWLLTGDWHTAEDLLQTAL